ncbi:MAG: hypothetical protein ACFFG0_04230 [Candidatus Thorarchaeota archaeon]
MKKKEIEQLEMQLEFLKNILEDQDSYNIAGRMLCMIDWFFCELENEDPEQLSVLFENYKIRILYRISLEYVVCLKDCSYYKAFHKITAGRNTSDAPFHFIILILGSFLSIVNAFMEIPDNPFSKLIREDEEFENFYNYCRDLTNDFAKKYPQLAGSWKVGAFKINSIRRKKRRNMNF